MRQLRVKRHIIADIHGAIEAAIQKEEFVLKLLEVKSFDEAIKELRSMVQDGYDFIPNADCDNQEYNGRCKGHEIWEKPTGGVTMEEVATGLTRMGHILSGRKYML